MADGGDGTVEVLLEALGGGWVMAPTVDALGAPMVGRFALLAGGDTAVVDVAEASGMARLVLTVSIRWPRRAREQVS